MSIDFFGTIIFALFALLVFKHDFKIKVTIFIGIVAAVLPLAVTKILAYLPYLISEMPMTIALAPSPAQVIILLLRVPITIFVLLMIRKDTESLSRFGVWVAVGIFVNDMLLPFIIR